VSQLTRSRSRVFSTPQRFPSRLELHGFISPRKPFLGFSLQSVPLTGIAHPSRGSLAPLRFSTNVIDVLLKCLRSDFTDSHTRKRSCLDPNRSYDSLSRKPWPPTWFPDVPGLSSNGTVMFRQLRSLRSLNPPASPFHPTRVAPSQLADTLLGFCPSRVFPSRPWAPLTHSDTRPELTP